MNTIRLLLAGCSLFLLAGCGKPAGASGTATPAAVGPELMAKLAKADALDGKTIALLWDDLFRGDEIWPILKQELGKRFSGVNFIDHDAFGSTHGDEEHRVLGELPGKIKSMNIDAVVSGMGC